MDIAQVKNIVASLKAEGKKVVFTNGCFDILHPGHTRYLAAARDLGDFLVVAVNSDRSTRVIKGDKRPVMPQDARTEVLAALSFVDLVTIFDEETPYRVIEVLQPDILVKGGDWKEDEIVGADIVKKAGGEVRRIPYISGYSTTEIIEKIKVR
ncbi:MAG: D-glycero-beta-D-manno-heptose 1-phosphate adenylyltransferase [Deltaproteobacteria bacterium]|nr:D-glycero-beta-D-manno-heptose 1-phosphate adenylyltransferase [Deltaproteobacteria bacterium]MBW2137339.1 D-glycero-beta-D-manno-heptose 1-phosphate adenylyltransferase [Deltaproteobacteria bacterium]